MIGAQRTEFRSNDDGEPSGTAGKPILGQINSNNLTDILIVVVRYFGGIKLGTSGLIQAYKSVAMNVIAESNIIEKTVTKEISVAFEYPLMNEVMKVVKDSDSEILSQTYDNKCRISLRISQSIHEQLIERFKKNGNIDNRQLVLKE